VTYAVIHAKNVHRRWLNSFLHPGQCTNYNRPSSIFSVERVSGRFVKQLQWECWPAQRKLKSGSKHRGLEVEGRPKAVR